MVSGMLTAIQDFVHDSFGAQDGQALQTMHVGELTVWVEQGPQAVLAGVIRGNAPGGLRIVFQEALEAIHLEQKQALEAFDGDPGAFEAAGPHLEDCLQRQLREQSEPGKHPMSPLTWVALAGAGAALVAWGVLSWQEQSRWQGYLDALNAEPGVVVTDSGRRDGRRFVSGMRDPLATDPRSVMHRMALDSAEVVELWEPYYSFVPDFVLKRAERLLDPPVAVSLAVEAGTLAAEGSASHRWILEARKLARAVPGVWAYHDDRLVDLDMERLRSVQAAVEGRSIFFAVGSSEPVPGQDAKLDELVGDVQKMLEMARPLGKRAFVEIRGHTDSTGSPTANQRLGRSRADAVRALLVARGIREDRLIPLGAVGEQHHQEERSGDVSLSRKATFGVRFLDVPGP